VRRKRDTSKKIDSHIHTYSEQSRESRKKHDKVRLSKIINDGPPINSIVFLIKLLFC
jgi:hypothetical protein